MFPPHREDETFVKNPNTHHLLFSTPFSVLRYSHTWGPHGRRRELTCVSCSVPTAFMHTYVNTLKSKQVNKQFIFHLWILKEKCMVIYISQNWNIVVMVWKSLVELEKALEYRVWCCHGFRHPLQPWNLSPTGRGGCPVPKSEIIESYEIIMVYCWEEAERLAKAVTPVSIPVSNTQRFWSCHVLPNRGSELLVTALCILWLWSGICLSVDLVYTSCWLMIPRFCLSICFCHCWFFVYLWRIACFAPSAI